MCANTLSRRRTGKAVLTKRHGRYHMPTTAVITGGKKSYCMEDSTIITGFGAPWVVCSTTARCDRQGLHPGWYDSYGPTLDCQWLDVTDLEEFGDFILEQCTNPDRLFQEMTFENNCIRTPVHIPPL